MYHIDEVEEESLKSNKGGWPFELPGQPHCDLHKEVPNSTIVPTTVGKARSAFSAVETMENEKQLERM